MRIYDAQRKLTEKKPQSIGGIKITFRKRIQPHIENEVIVLPDNSRCEFYTLNDNNFLFVFRSRMRSFGTVITYWFGGEDENHAFLAEITYTIFRVFKKEGTDAFYKALKPEFIQILERRLKEKARRQGDILILNLKTTWESLAAFLWIRDGESLDPDQGESQVFNTRHVINGRSIPIRNVPKGIYDAMLAEGSLTAPNHRAKRLKGVHVVTRIVGLVSRSGSYL